MEAILVIDVQNGCLTVPRYEIDAVIKRINILTEACRRAGKPVIFIQHNGVRENYMFPGTEDFEVVKTLHIEESDIRIRKEVNSAFYEPVLEEKLKSLGIDTLYVTGLATDFCVNATIMDALNKDYDVIVAGDAHTTADRGLLSAPQIIAFYNWLWPSLTPTGGRIEVKSTAEIESCILRGEA